MWPSEAPGPGAHVFAIDLLATSFRGDAWCGMPHRQVEPIFRKYEAGYTTRAAWHQVEVRGAWFHRIVSFHNYELLRLLTWVIWHVSIAYTEGQ